MAKPLLGPLVTLLVVIVLLEGVGHTVLHEAIFFGFTVPIFLLALVYFTFVDGLLAGLASMLITLAYYAITLSPLDALDVGRLALILAIFPAVVTIVGLLKRRLVVSGQVQGHLRAHSERVEAEVLARTQELRGVNERLKELDRLRSSMLDNITHELRTPLATIRGYAELLEDRLGGELTEEQSTYVEEIQGASGKLERLVTHLLDFTRLEAGTFALACAPLDLGEEVEDALEIQHACADERGVALAVNRPASPVIVPADHRCVATVLACLLDNALAFTGRGGHVDVSLGRTNGSARVAVRDTGIGIPAAQLPRIWEKFYQVDPSSTRVHGGAGLGLAIAKAMVEAHGGQMGVESDPGRGSTFWFTLPA
ncbi:MAG: integral rane sensor signal transduction histidine kinase [Cyanobacteria bacterium RYN_339]|nr:integral rane sensor signal transduction histidine kinase [Cyanobacteria bacterium RYN_339]